MYYNFLNKLFNDSNEKAANFKNNVYYENQLTENSKFDRRILKNIIKNKVKCANNREKLKL